MTKEENRPWRLWLRRFGGESGSEERIVREGFWPKLRRVASRLPFAEDLIAAYVCAWDRDTPLHVRAALIGALAYFVVPFDAIPDFIASLGYTDDAAVLLGTIKLIAGHISPDHRAEARRILAGEQAARPVA